MTSPSLFLSLPIPRQVAIYVGPSSKASEISRRARSSCHVSLHDIVCRADISTACKLFRPSCNLLHRHLEIRWNFIGKAKCGQKTGAKNPQQSSLACLLHEALTTATRRAASLHERRHHVVWFQPSAHQAAYRPNRRLLPERSMVVFEDRARPQEEGLRIPAKPCWSRGSQVAVESVLLKPGGFSKVSPSNAK